MAALAVRPRQSSGDGLDRRAEGGREPDGLPAGIPASGGDVRFSEDYQAAYLSAVWQAVEAVPEVSGGIVWCWADYRRRNGFTNDFPTYYGPFGVVTFERRPKKARAALRALWSGAKAPAPGSGQAGGADAPGFSATPRPN